MPAARPRRLVPALCLTLLLGLLGLLGLLAGCSGDAGAARSDTAADAAALQHEEQLLLDQRARAVREGNLHQFLRSIDRSNAGLVARQKRYFDNLRQLPLSTFRYRVMAASWPDALGDPAWGRHASLPRVRVLSQLAGFDDVPVAEVTGFAFARKASGLLIVSDRTVGGRPFPDSQPPPWELTRVKVRSSGSVLGVYDEATYARAPEVTELVQEGIDAVRAFVPFPWDGKAVVYVFSDREVLDSFQHVPGGNIRHLGAMTFPVYSATGDHRIVGSRFALMPSSVQAGQPFLGRIIRHELTHVAVGAHDDGVPVWLAEGIAEYVGARDLPQRERRIASVAVSRARTGVTGMPDSKSFNTRDQEWNYALSWMACDYIAAVQGEPRLWQVLDALHGQGAGASDSDRDAALLGVIGIDSHELALRARNRILRIYG